MVDIDKAVKELDKIARVLINIVPTKRIKVVVCGETPVLIFQPVPRDMPYEALNMLSTSLRAYGLFPIIKEKDDNLIVAYVKPVDVSECRQVKERESKLPEKLLKMETDADCIKLLTELIKRSGNRGDTMYMLILKKEGCEACKKLEEELYGNHLGLSEGELSLLIEAFDNIVEVSADKCKSFPAIFNVSGFPAFVLFVDGKPAEIKEGWSDEIKQWLIDRVFKMANAKLMAMQRLAQIKK
jgi:hypothetical protein